MRPEYKNWVPKGLVATFIALTTVLTVINVIVWSITRNISSSIGGFIRLISFLGLLGSVAGATWSVYAYRMFSYKGNRKLSKQIIEGTSEYVSIPDGGRGLDVGCGSGALTIACAKKNPNATMLGIDRWGKEYASFNRELCMENAYAEGVGDRTEFMKGDATALDFPDETFDAVTSNYVYHNIAGADKQKLLKETLRVLKKGGTFAIHDIMSKRRYGDMERFVADLKAAGYESVAMIDTTKGMFMSSKESKWMMLGGSALLVGKK